MNCSPRSITHFRRWLAHVSCACMLLALPAAAQTFEINQPSTGNSTAQRQKQRKGGKKGTGKTSAPSENGGQLGFGTSIAVGRIARAAQQALAHHKYARAQELAEQAVKEAPGDSRMWFLLGYTSRLSGNYKTS